MNFTLRCNRCGEFEWNFHVDSPDPSVGYHGGAYLESEEEECPRCGEASPSEGEAFDAAMAARKELGKGEEE